MVCVHTYSESDNRYGHLKFSNIAAGRHLEFDATGNGAVGAAVPENPTRTKHEVDRLTRCRAMAV